MSPVFVALLHAFNGNPVSVNKMLVVSIEPVREGSLELPSNDADPKMYTRITFVGGGFVEVRGTTLEVAQKIVNPYGWGCLTEAQG